MDVNGTTQTVCATTLGNDSANKKSGNKEDSFENSKAQEVKIFPNPNNGDFVIRVNSRISTIVDASGRKNIKTNSN